MLSMPSTPWSPQIEKRVHPLGEKGVRSSLDEVAKKAAEGANSFRVRKWVGDILDKGRKNGSKVNSALGRARVLLKAAQDKLWFPDPVGAEWIPGAHLMACSVDDKDGPCLKGDDCDGLAVLLGAACTCAGIPTLIVGHGYDKERNISHVLCAVHANDRWWYADPSTEYPIGEYMKFTRERILAIPSGKVVCDARNCLTRGAGISPDVTEPSGGGTFVGVNGPAEIVPSSEDVGGTHVGLNGEPVPLDGEGTFLDVDGLPELLSTLGTLGRLPEIEELLSPVRWLSGPGQVSRVRWI
jgi:hypothetical protein